MSDHNAAWQEVQACKTLFQVHEALGRLRPSATADVARWRAYRLRSAKAYEWIADVDRGHHHEALYWARREREQASQNTTGGGADRS
ncbi:MAG TPA: AMED_5909 family protein [Actinophytocola sp.]|uniref:AMED_5909 family protein n=1 Tax=Actinophytocola sp. TaxID=1872138 RepID=UPI002DBF4EE0|nr:AMED_5909 family protein [Actinophytocola sp.]HEU5472040.1 AMED_5909 family protein [Actinophytocola sp.]